jgi:hypothetical protein
LVASAVTAAAVVPFRYFPSDDGPTNLASARIITDHTGALQRYFTLDFFPKFDMLWELLLALGSEVMPPLVAERVLIVVLIVGLPMAAWYAIEAVRPGAGALAYLTLPVGIGWFLHSGYHSFCLGLVLFFVVVGYWRRHRDGGARAMAVLSALLVVTYLAHVTALLVALGLLGLDVAWPALVRGTGRPARRRWVALAAAAAPSLVLLAAYLATHESGGATQRRSLPQLVVALVTLKPALASFDPKERLPTTLLGLTVIVLVAVVAWRHLPRRVADARHAWLIGLIGLLAAYVVVPDRLGSASDISARISIFLLFVAVLWLAHLPIDRRTIAVVVSVSLLVTAGLTAAHVRSYRDFDRDLKDFDSVVAALPAGATVVPVSFVRAEDDHPGLARSAYTRPVIQATGYLVAERGVVDLSHFQGELDYFITQFRRELDPFATIGRGHQWVADVPPNVDLLGYEAATDGRGRIDDVLVWGRADASPDVLGTPAAVAVLDQLREGYELVFTSPGGHAELYRRRPAP